MGSTIEGVLGCPVPLGQGEHLLMSAMSGYTPFYSWQGISPLFSLHRAKAFFILATLPHSIKTFFIILSSSHRAKVFLSGLYHWSLAVLSHHKDA